MSNWLANATGIHISPKKAYVNRDQLGNALKNLAPASFLIPGVGPMAAAAIGGAGSALGRGMQHGANFGDILGQAASGASIAYGGGRGLQAAKSAFMPGSAPGSTVYSAMPGGGWSSNASAPMKSVGARVADAAGSGLKEVAGSAKNNLPVIGQVASGVLQARGQDAAADAQREQTGIQRDQLDFQKQQYQDQRDEQLARRKRLQELLAPLLTSYAPGAY